MFKGIWATLAGLVVEDGQLAIGALAALAITWALASAGGVAAHQIIGWVLLAMVLVLVVANLYRAGVVARSRVSSARR
jgi:thiosulfate reductase cytochrome b subunit